MEILELHLKHYGKFTDYRLKLHAGVNVICGDNETGKSTLHSFIRAMLYGLPHKSRGMDEYQLRQPRDNPDFFQGAMRVYYRQRIYRIERNFLKKDESLVLVCETDGKEQENPEALLRELRGGLSEETFDNTFFIRQAGAKTSAQLGTDIRNYLVNMERSGGTETDVKGALDLLKKRKKETLARKEQKRKALEQEGNENRHEAEYVRGEIDRLKGQLHSLSLEAKGSAFERRRNDAPEMEKNPEKAEHIDSEEIDELNELDEFFFDDPETEEEYVEEERLDRKERGDSFLDRSESMEEEGAALQEEEHEDPEDPEDLEYEEKSSLLLISLLFLAGVLSGACAFFAADRSMKIALLLLGLMLFLTTIVMILRMPQPDHSQGSGRREQETPDREERRRRREIFLNRHLGFREEEEPDMRPEEREKEGQQGLSSERKQGKTEDPAQKRLRDLEKNGDARIEDRKEIQKETQKEAREEVRIEARIEGQRQAVLSEIREKERRLVELDRLFEALGEERESLLEMDQECAAITMAAQRIETLSGQLYEEQGDQFAVRVSALLSSLTGGAYDRIAIDDRMEVHVNTPDHLLKVSQVSYGTMEQIYFALRLSAGKLLASGTVPVLLDEPFAMYDDERLEAALRYLRTCGRQVILFTCQRRELEILSEIEAG